MWLTKKYFPQIFEKYSAAVVDQCMASMIPVALVPVSLHFGVYKSCSCAKAAYRHKTFLQILVRLGADINARNSNGFALHLILSH